MENVKEFIKQHFGNLKSIFLKDFISKIIFENRNPDPSNMRIFSDFLKSGSNPEISLAENNKLFRCRKTSSNEIIKSSAPFYGLNEKESFVPPVEKTKDLRANYKYIPYLYCSNNPYIALAELKPKFNTVINIAEITVLKSLRILNFTEYELETKKLNPKENFFNDLSTVFSLPIEDDDETIEYIPTQFIAEYVKNLGYDGIAYRSSVTPEINNAKLPRFNYVIFNYDETCKVTKTNLVKISNSYFDTENLSQEDQNPIQTTSWIEEELDKL